MINKSFIYKIPNGKMLRVMIDLDGQKISKIKITGDFFIHPEESIVEIEKAVLNCNQQTEEELTKKIEKAIEITHAKLIGVDAKSMAFAIHSALVSG